MSSWFVDSTQRVLEFHIEAHMFLRFRCVCQFFKKRVPPDPLAFSSRFIEAYPGPISRQNNIWILKETVDPGLTKGRISHYFHGTQDREMEPFPI